MVKKNNDFALILNLLMAIKWHIYFQEHKRGALLFFEVFCQISRSNRLKNGYLDQIYLCRVHVRFRKAKKGGIYHWAVDVMFFNELIDPRNDGHEICWQYIDLNFFPGFEGQMTK